jgi:CheY-like chemotaxis protein
MSDKVQGNQAANAPKPKSKARGSGADSALSAATREDGGLSPVLLAEDNPDDVYLIRQALRETRALNPLQVVGNGEQAIHYLAGEGEFADRSAYPFPALFLLDLKMPVKDGLEVLRWLNQHPDIPQRLPVVVLSSTELPSETQIAYAMDIQACIVKPLAYAELRERIRILKEYWLDYEAAV